MPGRRLIVIQTARATGDCPWPYGKATLRKRNALMPERGDIIVDVGAPGVVKLVEPASGVNIQPLEATSVGVYRPTFAEAGQQRRFSRASPPLARNVLQGSDFSRSAGLVGTRERGRKTKRKGGCALRAMANCILTAAVVKTSVCNLRAARTSWLILFLRAF